MKKAISFLLLILFLYSIAGIFITFKLQQHGIKKEIKAKIKSSVPENELILLSFHPFSKEYSELEWIENHEFRYKGQMFDIVRQSGGADGTLHFYCINDKQEEKLFADLDECVARNMNTKNNSNSSSKNILKLFSLLYFSNTPTITFFSEKDLFPLDRYTHKYLSPSLEIVSPPPRFA